MVCRCPDGPDGVKHVERALAAAEERRRYEEQSKDKQIKKLQEEVAQLTVKADNYEIVAVATEGQCLVLAVRYPGCKKCEFESTKVMVFENVNTHDALKWSRIDPHFRAGPCDPNEAPSPFARFPNTPAGWEAALQLARMVSG